MEYELIKVERKGQLTVITIDRPEVRNAINPLTSIEMGHAIDEFRDDPNAGVAIVTHRRGLRDRPGLRHRDRSRDGHLLVSGDRRQPKWKGA